MPDGPEPHAPPLTGVRVLDLTRVLAGPWATMTLGDLGAEVWKIEHPVDGDEARSWQPPAFAGTSTYFLSVNRNKASVAVDFRTSGGRNVVRELARRADVLVENYVTGTLERHGLGYADLAPLNPRLIYCSISGYGRNGAFAQRAGYDVVVQAESGLMSVTGEPAGPPQRVGIAVDDIVTGGFAVQAVLAALYARGRTGRGQHVDLALHDCAIAILPNLASAALNGGGATGRYGNAHPSIVPYQSFEAADASFVLACANNRQFRDLCAGVLERPELAQDARFATNPQRVANRDALVELLAQAFARRPLAEILAACRRVNVPAGRVRTVPEALASPEVAEREMVVRAGEARLVGSPLRFSETPVRPASAPPALGADTEAVLRDVLGYEAARIAALRRNGAIG